MGVPPVAVSAGTYGGLSDGPITPGESIPYVFDAPDFSITTRLSESGDVHYPILGLVIWRADEHSAAEFLTKELKDRHLSVNPEITSQWIQLRPELPCSVRSALPGSIRPRENICCRICLRLRVG